MKEAAAASAARSAEQEARAQRDEAVRQRDMAVARQLAVHAERASTAQEAVLLAAESLHLRTFTETEALLRGKLALLPRVAHHVALRGHAGRCCASLAGVDVQSRGTYFAATKAGIPLQVIDVQSGRTVLRQIDDPTRAEFSAGEDLLAVANNNRQAWLVRLPEGFARKIVDWRGRSPGSRSAPTGGACWSDCGPTTPTWGVNETASWSSIRLPASDSPRCVPLARFAASGFRPTG